MKTNRDRGHVLIFVLILLMLSSLLLTSAVKTLEHDSVSTHDFQNHVKSS